MQTKLEKTKGDNKYKHKQTYKTKKNFYILISPQNVRQNRSPYRHMNNTHTRDSICWAPLKQIHTHIYIYTNIYIIIGEGSGDRGRSRWDPPIPLGVSSPHTHHTPAPKSDVVRNLGAGDLKFSADK